VWGGLQSPGCSTKGCRCSTQGSGVSRQLSTGEIRFPELSTFHEGAFSAEIQGSRFSSGNEARMAAGGGGACNSGAALPCIPKSMGGDGTAGVGHHHGSTS
jgi:hypothetical protein